MQRYLDQFQRFIANGAASAPERVTSARKTGIARFEAAGFPTTKDEDWHFTSPSPIAEREFTFEASASGSVSAAEIKNVGFGRDWHTVVFVNGRYAPAHSTRAELKGVRILSLAEAWTSAPDLAKKVGTVLTAQPTFTALNSAFMPDGAVIHVEKAVEVATPIHVIFVVDDTAKGRVMYPRNLIVAERGAKVTVVESYVATTDASYFTNAVTEVVVGDGATVTHTKVQSEARKAYHVGTTEATQARNSHYVSFSFATGASLSRTNIYTKLAGEGSGATLNGLYMLDGDQHCDHQTRIEHVEPNCFSREVYKGVIDDKAHGVFNGKVYVHPEAQKTDGKQTNNSLLLSKEAHVDTKPQLEIFADDVKCTHGATVGKLDEMALFYMKSRGVDADTAKQLLIYAFAADVLETIEQADVRHALERITVERFVDAADAVGV